MLSPILNNHPLRQAFKEFEAADIAYRKLIGISQKFSDYETAWREVLHHIERVWTKTQAAVHNQPGWKKIESEIGQLRKNDALLQYVIQARNTDEHSIQDMVKEYEWNLTLTVEENGVVARWAQWDRPLLPVCNRGVTYQPPRIHLGKSISHLLGKGKAEPRVIAELAMNFYVEVLNRASIDVVGNNYGPSTINQYQP